MITCPAQTIYLYDVSSNSCIPLAENVNANGISPTKIAKPYPNPDAEFCFVMSFFLVKQCAKLPLECPIVQNQRGGIRVESWVENVIHTKIRAFSAFVKSEWNVTYSES